MAKKKENPPVEEKKTGEAEKAANTAAENEIPESVTTIAAGMLPLRQTA